MMADVERGDADSWEMLIVQKSVRIWAFYPCPDPISEVSKGLYYLPRKGVSVSNRAHFSPRLLPLIKNFSPSLKRSS